MDLNDTPELAEYRAKVRAWLDEHKREAPASRGDDYAAVAARRAWQQRLAEGRLAAVTWPAEYGGAGLGPLQQVVVNQEIGRAGVPGIFDIIGVGRRAEPSTSCDSSQTTAWILVPPRSMPPYRAMPLLLLAADARTPIR